jgi:hypothetical protein
MESGKDLNETKNEKEEEELKRLYLFNKTLISKEKGNLTGKLLIKLEDTKMSKVEEDFDEFEDSEEIGNCLELNNMSITGVFNMTKKMKEKKMVKFAKLASKQKLSQSQTVKFKLLMQASFKNIKRKILNSLPSRIFYPYSVYRPNKFDYSVAGISYKPTILKFDSLLDFNTTIGSFGSTVSYENTSNMEFNFSTPQFTTYYDLLLSETHNTPQPAGINNPIMFYFFLFIL